MQDRNRCAGAAPNGRSRETWSSQNRSKVCNVESEAWRALYALDVGLRCLAQGAAGDEQADDGAPPRRVAGPRG